MTQSRGHERPLNVFIHWSQIVVGPGICRTRALSAWEPANIFPRHAQHRWLPGRSP